LAAAVDMALPVMPSGGMGPKPRISNGFNPASIATVRIMA
jgi:hypothetical protein